VRRVGNTDSNRRLRHHVFRRSQQQDQLRYVFLKNMQWAERVSARCFSHTRKREITTIKSAVGNNRIRSRHTAHQTSTTDPVRGWMLVFFEWSQERGGKIANLGDVPEQRFQANFQGKLKRVQHVDQSRGHRLIGRCPWEMNIYSGEVLCLQSISLDVRAIGKHATPHVVSGLWGGSSMSDIRRTYRNTRGYLASHGFSHHTNAMSDLRRWLNANSYVTKRMPVFLEDRHVIKDGVWLSPSTMLVAESRTREC